MLVYVQFLTFNDQQTIPHPSSTNRLPSLHTLLLEENELGNPGAKRLAKTLGQCTKLETLKLTHNEIKRCVLRLLHARCLKGGLRACSCLQSSYLVLCPVSALLRDA